MTAAAAFVFGLDRQRVPAGLVDLHRPDRRAALKFWKWPVSSTVNFSICSPTRDFDLAAALPLAAALQHLDGERARLRDRELPRRPVVLVHPVAERVLVRQRLVAQHDAVDLGRAGVQRDRAVLRLRVGHVVRVRRRHLRADLLPPRRRACRPGSSTTSGFSAARLRLSPTSVDEVEQLAAAVLVELDQLEVAGADRAAGPAALVGVVRVVPVQRVAFEPFRPSAAAPG